MYDLDDDVDSGKQRKFFNLKVCGARLGEKELVNLKFDPVEPEESVNGKFTFQPK